MKSQKVLNYLQRSNFLCADFETSPIEKGIQKFIIGGITNGKKFWYTDNLDEFMDSLSKFERKIIYFHNLSYDYRFMLNYLINHEFYDFEIINSASKVISIKIYAKTKHKKINIYEMRDSYSLLPVSLKALSHGFCQFYRKKDYDATNITKIDNELISYLKWDCLSLYEVLIRFSEIIKKKKLNLTIASLSKSLWLKTFDMKKIIAPHFLYDFFKKSMYGGRTEVFIRKVENGFYYDFNSLYPYVMKKNYFPVGKCEYFVENEYKNYDFYIAKIKNLKIKQTENDIYPIPFRYKGLIFYPHGEIKEGIYNNIDLSFLNDYEIIEGWGWKFKEKIFEKYMNEYYQWKEKASRENNTAKYMSSKFLLNSLWGKLGQSNYNVEIKKISDYSEFLDYENENYLGIESTFIPNIFKIHKKSYQSITNHIASFVLSYARKELYNKMIEIKNNGGNIFYCDTDSIITDIIVKHDKYKLGKLKLEDEIIEGYFPLPKLYAYKNKEDKITIKGKGLMIDQLNYYQIQNMVEKNEIITNNSVRISKLISILNGRKEICECYNLDKKIDPFVYTKRQFDGKYNTKSVRI